MLVLINWCDGDNNFAHCLSPETFILLKTLHCLYIQIAQQDTLLQFLIQSYLLLVCTFCLNALSMDVIHLRWGGGSCWSMKSGFVDFQWKSLEGTHFYRELHDVYLLRWVSWLA